MTTESLLAQTEDHLRKIKEDQTNVLVLTFDIPEEMSGEEASEQITQAAEHINQFYIALGGKGLSVLDVKVESIPLDTPTVHG